MLLLRMVDQIRFSFNRFQFAFPFVHDLEDEGHLGGNVLLSMIEDLFRPILLSLFLSLPLFPTLFFIFV